MCARVVPCLIGGMTGRHGGSAPAIARTWAPFQSTLVRRFSLLFDLLYFSRKDHRLCVIIGTLVAKPLRAPLLLVLGFGDRFNAALIGDCAKRGAWKSHKELGREWPN
jgi:hypothetical protein